MKHTNEVEFLPLEEVHSLLLYLLKQINLVSEKTGIPYFAHAGTLIGVLRHKGFIPWDDDIDLLMERKYCRDFVAACETYFPDQVVVQSAENDPYFCEEYIKICFRDDFCHFSELAIDIFIMDETNPNRNFLRWLQNKIIRWVRPVKVYKVSRMVDYLETYVPRNPFKRLYLGVVSHLFTLKFLNRLQQWAYTADKGASDYLVDWGCNTGYKRGTRPKAFFQKAVKMPFENTYIYSSDKSVELADFVFKRIPWRIIPPPEKRKTHNVHRIVNSRLDFEKIRSEVEHA